MSDLVLFFGCWLNGGRSKCKLAIDCVQSGGISSDFKTDFFNWKIKLWRFDSKIANSKNIFLKKKIFEFHAVFKCLNVSCLDLICAS